MTDCVSKELGMVSRIETVQALSLEVAQGHIQGDHRHSAGERTKQIIQYRLVDVDAM